MISAVLFTVRGTPRPQPRPRFVNGRAVSTISRLAKLWRNAVKRGAAEALAAHGNPNWLQGPVLVTITAYFQTRKPARHGQAHAVRPDSDNIAKLALDAMQDAGLLPMGDQQVAELFIQKLWGPQSFMIVLVRPAPTRPMQQPTPAPGWLAEG